MKQQQWLLIAGTGTLLVFALLIFVGIPITSADGTKLQTIKQGTQWVAGVPEDTVVTQELRAMVKGSIYETGEAVAVYGTCLNATDDGVQNSYGQLSAWYPNGTLAFANASMMQIQVGYFTYIAPMLPVEGTYLTEFTCYVNGTDIHAKAFGEWQNPHWVERIALLNSSIAQVQISVDNLSNNTQAWFNITWSKIDSINVTINTTSLNLTAQFAYVAMVANASVDRNDSYLAHLLQSIAATIGTPVNHSLFVTQTADPVVINKDWQLAVSVKNEYNVTVGSPLVSCFLNTTNIPPTVNQAMTAKDSNTDHPSFTWQEKIKSLSFSWTVRCVYN